jgi:hypothetical protein
MNNSAAMGYMILAAQSLGMSNNEIKALERAMKQQMDFQTEAKAEVTYRKF